MTTNTRRKFRVSVPISTGAVAHAAQRGAVSIMVAFMLVAMIGLLGLVSDLGNLYVRKTELQNAADAAALAGARQINSEPGGLDAAASGAIQLAFANASDFGKTPVGITESHIRFGPTPDGPWSDLATAKANAAAMSFIRVDTSGIAQGSRPTWFMSWINAASATTTTSGIAVAGATVCEGLPMFICPPPGGFSLGQPYLFGEDPSVVGYFDPVTPGAPSLVPPGANEMSDIVCAGKVFCIGAGTYSSRTQAAFGKMEKAFNTRFGEFKGELKDSYESCRPDSNVKEYLPGAVNWMTTMPENKLSVHWSAYRPPTLPGVPPVNGSYPSAASGGGTPYTQTAAPDHLAPHSEYLAYQQGGRRMITLAIADPSACDASGIGTNFQGAGKAIPVAEFGRFVMQKKYDKGIVVEYIGTIPRLSASAPDIKLFR